MIEELEKNKVLLWGQKKVPTNVLKEYDHGNKNPSSKAQVKSKTSKKTVKIVKQFDPEENYGIEDLSFLESEYDRITAILEKGGLDDEEDEKIMDLQDKLYDLIEVLKEAKEKFGGGINDVPIKEDKHAVDQSSPLVDYVPVKKGRPAKGSPEALEIGRRLAEAKKAKLEGKPKPVVIKNDKKARAEKGSEEAKNINKKLLEAKALKKQAKEPKTKEYSKKLKPWFYIGDIPNGYRPATEDEALEENKVSEYGKYEVDPVKYYFYTNYKLLLSVDLPDYLLPVILRSLPKRIDNSYKDIDIYTAKLDNPKHEKHHEHFREKLIKEKRANKDYQKAYRWYQKLYALRKGIQVPAKVDFTPKRIQQEIQETKTIIHPTPKPQTNYGHNSELAPKAPPKTHYAFKNDKETIEIPIKAFDKKMVLKPKYADKLHKKGVLLHPHHYDENDSEKYFYKHIKGGAITTTDLHKLLKASYSPELGDISNYKIDKEISNETAQVYRNEDNNRTYVVHRGTKEASDWLNNLVYAISPSLYKYTDRYKTGKETQEKALEKYGPDIDVLGHSQGSKIAELASYDDPRVKNVITYNRPLGLVERLFKPNDNLLDIKTSRDPVSLLTPFQAPYFDTKNWTLSYGNKPLIIPSLSKNPVEEHKLAPLLSIPEQMLGNGIVNRKPDLNHNEIVQSVVFHRPKWTKITAKKWLKDNSFHYDSIDTKPTQIRFRQFNPEDFYNYHYISKNLKNTGILLIIAMKNVTGGTIYRSEGGAIMLNNVNHYTPQEMYTHNIKHEAHIQHEHKKHLEKLDKEQEDILKRTKKATKTRLKKGSQEAKDRMARMRAMKKK